MTENGPEQKHFEIDPNKRLEQSREAAVKKLNEAQLAARKALEWSLIIDLKDNIAPQRLSSQSGMLLKVESSISACKQLLENYRDTGQSVQSIKTGIGRKFSVDPVGKSMGLENHG